MRPAAITTAAYPVDETDVTRSGVTRTFSFSQAQRKARSSAAGSTIPSSRVEHSKIHVDARLGLQFFDERRI